MRTIGYVLIILFNIFLLSACNSSNVNSSDHPSSKSDVVANHTNEPLSEEVKVEEKPSKDIITLIPSGWRVLIQDDEPVTTEGDLNKDGVTDVAMIIEQLQPNTEEAPERSLLIAFGTNDSYLLSIIADKVILKSDEGGVWETLLNLFQLIEDLLSLVIMEAVTGDGTTNIDLDFKIMNGI